MNSPSSEVGPGFLAFVAFFFLAVCLWLLMRNMFTRLRRMSLAQRAEEQDAKRSTEPGRSAAPGRTRESEEAPEGGASGVGDRSEEREGRGDEV